MQHTPSSSSAGFVVFGVILMLLVLLVIAVTGYFIFHDNHSHSPAASSTTSSQATSTPKNSYATLSPATVPSKAPECSTPISFQGNGNSGPIQCPNGDLNVTEWNALSALEPTVMSLGYSASASQVQAALCKDATASASDANTTNSFIVEGTVYQITALYYGWSFPSNPSAILSSGSC
jgi:hypothetical protein